MMILMQISVSAVMYNSLFQFAIHSTLTNLVQTDLKLTTMRLVQLQRLKLLLFSQTSQY